MLNRPESRLALVIIASSFVLGCALPEQPAAATAPQLIVQGVIDARSRFQTLLISRARTGAQQDTISVGITHDQPVTGAIVTLTLPTGQTLVANQFGPDSSIVIEPDGAYSFNTADFASNPIAGTYTLHVRTATGEEVSGSTSMPTVEPALSTISSFGSFRRLQDTLRLSWPRVPGARSYEVVIRSSASQEYRIFSDTSVAIPGTTLTIQGDMVFPPGVAVNVIVSAVDANYYDYYRAQSDPFAGAPPSHLTGAVGVFGSIATVLVGTIFVR